MGENEQPTEARSRRWVPWTVTGGVIVVAATVAAALVLPGLLRAPAAPASAPTSPAPSATPPAEATCDSRLDATPPAPFDVSATGALTRLEVDALEVDAVGTSPVWVDTVRVDDDVLALVTSINIGAERLARLTVVEETSGRTRWASTFSGDVQILASPATSGIGGRLLIAHQETGDPRILTLDLADGDLAASAPSEVASYGPVSLFPAGEVSRPAVQAQSAYFVRDQDTVTRLHAATLQPEWTISGVPFDAPRHEGGGFNIVVAGDVLFISGIAFDAETGDELGWSVDGTVVAGGGQALVMPVRHDTYGPFPLSATDLRTGEACWTLEVLAVQADGTDLWVVDAAREVQRIDPQTGDVVERRGTVPVLTDIGESITLVVRDGIVATTTFDMDTFTEGETLSWAPDGAVRLPEPPSFVSNGQFVTHVTPAWGEPGRLEAYAPDGSLLWTTQMDAQRSTVGLADADTDEAGRVSIVLVR